MPGTSPGMTKKCDLLRRSREQQQITVRVLHNEISRAPGLALERLEERHAGGLKLEEQRFDFLRGRDGERGRQQLLTVSQFGIDHRRLDIGERDGEAEFSRKEFAR